MPQSLPQGKAHNGLSKMFIRWIILTVDINEVSHRIVLWADILRISDDTSIPEPTVKDRKDTGYLWPPNWPLPVH